MDEAIVRIGEEVPDFSVKAFHNGEFKSINLSDYKGKWLILAFYPADFTYICPTELARFADSYEQFKDLNCEILSISTDTEQVHKAWHDTSASIKKIKFPMVADPVGKICKAFGTYIYDGDDEGRSLRATMIISPEGILKSLEVHDNSIGRSVKEILRKLKAAVYVSGHEGEVCPVEWEEGQGTLRPGVNLVGKI